MRWLLSPVVGLRRLPSAHVLARLDADVISRAAGPACTYRSDVVRDEVG
ncbi:hypothetical protein [Lentzea flava]|nr:hypothetical protein [Lentzea flava]